jgi:hypothetical protein
MIATQRVFMCTTSSMLSIANDVIPGFSITIGRADMQNASARSAGQCLPAGFESATEDVARPSSQASIAAGANEAMAASYDILRAAATAGSKTAGKLTSKLSAVQMKIPMHYLDAMITWAMGVVSGLQDMTQVN